MSLMPTIYPSLPSRMASFKPKAYKMLLNLISIDSQPVLIARQATLGLQDADSLAKGEAESKASGQLMELQVDDRILVSL